jgi:hypothetical protein
MNSIKNAEKNNPANDITEDEKDNLGNLWEIGGCDLSPFGMAQAMCVVAAVKNNVECLGDFVDEK